MEDVWVSIKELERSEKTRSAAADEGCTSETVLQAFDHSGSSFSCYLHQSNLSETSSALAR